MPPSRYRCRNSGRSSYTPKKTGCASRQPACPWDGAQELLGRAELAFHLLDTHFRTDDPLLAEGQTGWAHSRPATPPRAGEDRGRVVPHPAHLPRWRAARTPEYAPDMLPCHFAMRFSREEVISGLPMR
ncbi:MAG: hypothetical protein LBP86_06205 [Azoarcus sp.]|nr:hypothetical protein [Azoarcus sp.]